MSELKKTAQQVEREAEVEREIAEFAASKGWSQQEIARALAPRPAPMLIEGRPAGMSAEIDQLAAALAIAKGQMFSPVRNKHVSVTKKDGTTYSFRYTSLDVINDMLRLPLFENGLSILHINRPNARGALFMASRLLHRSGQYMDSVLPIVQSPNGDSYIADGQVFSGPQKLGSLLTFAKRYNICALLDIAAQDDDDANIAEGNLIIDHEFPVEPNAQLRVLQDRYARLVAAAANARDPAGIGEMLKRWQKGMEFWDRMRLEGDLENWDRLMNLIPAAIERVHGKILAAAFHDGATATRMSQMDAIREIWDSPPGQAERASMKALNPISYGMLFEHLRMQKARVEREEEAAAEQLRKQAEQAAHLAAIREEGSPFDGDLLAAPAGADNRPDMTFRQVRDEFGEFVTDELTRETDWARAYVAEWQNAENRTALREHNLDGLAWAEQYIESQVILMNGLGKERFAPPETEAQAPAVMPTDANISLHANADMPEPATFEPPIAAETVAPEPVVQDDPRQLPLLPEIACVALHKTARGTPDLSRYLRAVKISLDQTGPSEIGHWEEVNLPTVDGLPRGTQLEIMGVLARRKQTLGVAA